MKAVLVNAQQGHAALMGLWHEAKAHLMAGRRMVIELKEATRTLEQNAKFHVMCGDFAKSKVEWMGKPRTEKQWKVLLVSGHAIVTNEETEVIPGLEGEFINIRESTALMSIKRGSSLIEYTYATGVHLGVRFSCPEEVAV